MITGAHVILYTPAADALRAFLRDVLELDGVDAGDGWPILSLPPTELAVHPDDGTGHELFLLTDDIEATIARLAAKGITVGPISEQSWGRLIKLPLPDGTTIGLYQPTHARPTPQAGG